MTMLPGQRRSSGLLSDKFDPKNDPCDCECHDSPEGTVRHFAPCCAYTYEPRVEASAKAAEFREEAAGGVDAFDPVSGPCDCACHEDPDMKHMEPCCFYSNILRDEAETQAAEAWTNALTKKDT